MIAMVKELLNAYEEKRGKSEAAAALIADRADQCMKAAAKLEKRAGRKREEAKRQEEKLRKMPVVDWKEEVIIPLAEEMAKRIGKHPVVFGPCGIGAKVTICLTDDPAAKWTEQDRLELTIEPDFEDGRMIFNYETGEVSDRYEPGTVGYVNGLNNITARLPDSVEEILGLLRHYPALTTKTKEGGKT